LLFRHAGGHGYTRHISAPLAPLGRLHLKVEHEEHPQHDHRQDNDGELLETGLVVLACLKFAVRRESVMNEQPQPADEPADQASDMSKVVQEGHKSDTHIESGDEHETDQGWPGLIAVERPVLEKIRPPGTDWVKEQKNKQKKQKKQKDSKIQRSNKIQRFKDSKIR
jgi:hypothetical protein